MSTPSAEPIRSPRDAAGLLSGTLLLGLGERLAERFIPLFLTNLGGTALAVGGYQAAMNLVGAVAALPGGVLTDRVGSKSTLQWSAAFACGGFLLLALAPSWPVAALGALAAQSWSAVSLPAALVLVTRAIPARNSAWGVSLHSFVRRIPMALGPLMAGALIAAQGEGRGLRVTFLLALALGIAALLAQQLFIRPASLPRDAGDTRPHARFDFRRAVAGMSPELRHLFVADTLIRFCEQIPYALVVLWCMRQIAHPITALQFGQLTALEMIVAMLVYAPGAWLSSRIGKPATVAVTFAFFFLFPIVLLASRTIGALIVAFTLRGMKEIGEPTRKSLILDLCPEQDRATHFGAYYCVRDSLAAVAAGLGAALWEVRPTLALAGASCFGLAGLVWYSAAAARSARRPRPVAAGAA